MRGAKKAAPQLRAVQPKPLPKPVTRGGASMQALRPQTVVTVQKKASPVAPAVYCPQPAKKVVQAKKQTAPLQARKPPVAPAVYRPKPVSKNLQPLLPKVPKVAAAERAQTPPVPPRSPKLPPVRGRASTSQQENARLNTAVQRRPTGAQNVLQRMFSIGKSKWDIRAEQLRKQDYTEREIERQISHEKHKERRKKREKELGRRGKSKKAVSSGAGVPSGYQRLSDFNADTNKYGKFPGLKGRGVDESQIYVKVVPLASGKEVPFLWWANAMHTIKDFVYLESSAQDIKDCNTVKSAKGYTWHHTGDSMDESYGTMQLVPTDEHSSLAHYGGNYLAYKEVG